MTPRATFQSAKRRTAAAIGVSIALHALVAWRVSRERVEPQPAPDEKPVEIEVRPLPRPSAGGGGREGADAPRRPTKPPRSQRASSAPSPSPTPSTTPDLLRMRGDTITLTPTDDLLARALGPAQAPPPAADKPRRTPRLPGTGLTTLTPESDENVQLAHPRFYEVLDRTTRRFRPDFQRTADEVRGELNADKTLKRWLFGTLGNDPEAMSNLVPSIACLVCVTLRPGASPEIELAGPSGSPWFDRAATESLTRGAVRQRPDEPFDPARACYRFAAKVWRTRPDLSNLLAIPFKLNFRSTVRLVSYEKLGG